MGHPQMFDDDDPVLERVRRIALALPGAAMKISHGRPAFFTTKVFCHYGGSVKVDGQYERHEQSILVQPTPDDRRALLDDERTYLPAYLTPSGWIGLDLAAGCDWDEVTELIEESFRLTAPKRLVATLDEGRP